MGVCIIAEAGVNHNGNVELAKKMVEAAKESGADYIKFQTFIPENLVTTSATMADYQIKNSKETETQLEMLRKLALSNEEFVSINEYCEKLKIGFLSTPFDNESIEFLNGLGMKVWKIPSGDITNLPYLIKIARIGKPVILSTGMSTMLEIENALTILRKNGNEDITVLHCTSEYPAPYEEINLKAMNTIKNEFKVPVGYSDHTQGVEISLAAVALGATVIEKHFTLDRCLDGPDHKASLEPNELKTMVKAIRNIENALGDGLKNPSISEKKNIAIARKSIVAKRNIKRGETFAEENLTVKRPGSGISPMKWFEVIGKEACRDFAEDELINYEEN